MNTYEDHLIKCMQNLYSAIASNNCICAQATEEEKDLFCQIGVELSILVQKLNNQLDSQKGSREDLHA